MTYKSHKTRTVGEYSSDSKEFHLKEFECIRKEIEILITERFSLERNVVVAVGVSWGWLFHERTNVPSWAWLIPCMFAALGFARSFGLSHFFRAASAYLMTVKDAFFKPGDPAGWEHSIRGQRWTRLSTIAFWSILITLTAVVAACEMKYGVAHQIPISSSVTHESPSNSQ